MKRKLKILFTTTNRSNLVCINALHYLEQAVGKIAECKWLRENRKGKEDRHKSVLRVMPDADWVFHAGMGYKPPPPSKRTYKIGLFTSDIHHSRGLNLNPMELVKRWNGARFDAYFMSYTKLAYRSFPLKKMDPNYYINNLKAPIFHLAPSVSPEVFKPLKGKKRYDVAFLAQAHYRIHPLRWMIKNNLPTLCEKNGWRLIMRGRPPGRTAKRRIGVLLQQGFIVGPKYAETLALSRAFIFGLGRFKYPCLKFVEGMASGTCVFSDPPLTGGSIHFEPDVNYVRINKQNWQQKLTYYLTHEEERAAIAQKGYEDYLKYHTSDVRAAQLLSFMRENL